MDSVAMVFEDNSESQLGSLLKSCYNKNLYFTSSNSKLLSYIKYIYKKYDTIIVFFDLVPDNDKLLPILEKLCISVNKIDVAKKVHIIPIVCSEYIYMSMLNSVLNLDLDLSFESALKYHESRVNKSSEKYYKSLLRKSNIDIGNNIDNECEHFYTSYPCFSLNDFEHKDYLYSLGIQTRYINLLDIIEDTIKLFDSLFSLHGKSFKMECKSKSIKLF